jgi:ribosomal protein L22
MSVKQSLDLLEHMPKKAGKILGKVIKTAVANSGSKDGSAFEIDTVQV